jgi:hypothetical protein
MKKSWIIASTLLFSSYGFAANYVYTGAGADPNNWFLGGNWAGGGGVEVYPTELDNALFTNEGVGMVISQSIPIPFGQLHAGRFVSNTVTIATGAELTNLNQTLAGVNQPNQPPFGDGTIIIDGGTLNTVRLRMGVNGATGFVHVVSGLVNIDKAPTGDPKGTLDFELMGGGDPSFKLSGGTVTMESNLLLDAGLLTIDGADGTMTVDEIFLFNTAELAFEIADSGISKISADSIEFTGTQILTVNGQSTTSDTLFEDLVLIELTGSDTISAGELSNLSSALNLESMASGSLSLSGDSKQLLFTGTTAPIPVPLPFDSFTADTSNLIQNGDFSTVLNPVFGNAAAAINIDGTFGDFGPFNGSGGEVEGWLPYFSDPNGLTDLVGDPGVNNSGDDPVPALEGTFYLDTHWLPNGSGSIGLNSSNNYRNGFGQTDILNGVTIIPAATYELTFSAVKNAGVDNTSATLTLALTTGANVADTTVSVANSLSEIAVDSLPAVGEPPLIVTSTISGADLASAQSGVGSVNVYFDQVNTATIPGLPDSLASTDISNVALVSQARIDDVGLTLVLPENDLNKDGVFDQSDVDLAQLYLDGDGGDTAAIRQSTLINDLGFTPAEALEFLNLTEFDLNEDGTFDAADVAALQALLVSIPFEVTISITGGELEFTWNSSPGKFYDLESKTSLLLPDWVPYNDGVTTYENIPASGTGTTSLSNVLAPAPEAFFRVVEKD